MAEQLTEPDPLPAWATAGTHVTAACTSCRETVKDGDGDEIWFGTAAGAAEHVAMYTDGRVDGDMLTCAPCLAKAACEAAGGHQIETFTHTDHKGLGWYCRRPNCPATGLIREEEAARADD